MGENGEGKGSHIHTVNTVSSQYLQLTMLDDDNQYMFDPQISDHMMVLHEITDSHTT